MANKRTKKNITSDKSLSTEDQVMDISESEVEKLITKHHVGLKYEPGDPDSLIKQIITLKEDVNMHQYLSNNAKTIFLEKFEYNKVYGDIVYDLERIIEKSCL